VSTLVPIVVVLAVTIIVVASIRACIAGRGTARGEGRPVIVQEHVLVLHRLHRDLQRLLLPLEEEGRRRSVTEADDVASLELLLMHHLLPFQPPTHKCPIAARKVAHQRVLPCLKKQLYLRVRLAHTLALWLD
jgi:hypothetical protein